MWQLSNRDRTSGPLDPTEYETREAAQAKLLVEAGFMAQDGDWIVKSARIDRDQATDWVTLVRVDDPDRWVSFLIESDDLAAFPSPSTSPPYLPNANLAILGGTRLGGRREIAS